MTMGSIKSLTPLPKPSPQAAAIRAKMEADIRLLQIQMVKEYNDKAFADATVGNSLAGVYNKYAQMIPPKKPPDANQMGQKWDDAWVKAMMDTNADKKVIHDPAEIIPKRIHNVPLYLEKNTLKPFVEQLCSEIERFRYTEEGQLLVMDGSRFAAVPACVVSRKVFNYMLMACNPLFRRHNGGIGDRLTYATVRKFGEDPLNINYNGVSTHNGNLFSIADNSLDALSFIDSAVPSYEEMKIVSAQSTIRFGIDPDLEDWQARVCFDDGSNKKLTVGMTDNRLYE